MPTYQITTDKGTYQVDTQGDDQVPSSSQATQQAITSTDGQDQTSADLGEASNVLSNIDNNQTSDQSQEINPNSTGNIGTDIAGDVARGFINSGAGTIDKINGAVKLLKNATSVDLGSEGLTNVSNQLKKLASQQPQSSNPILSGIGQFVGSTPDAIAEFASSGEGVGFIARSAALAAADAYNKTQSGMAAVKSGVVGGTVGAVLDKIPGALEGTAQLARKWGQTAGKTYLQAVTGATDKEAQELIDKLPEMDINPKSKVEDYNEAKDNANEQINSLKENNSNLLDQQKEQNTKEYESSKSISDDAVNSLIENNKDTIDNLRQSQSENKQNLADSTSTNMLAATDAAAQRLADAASSTTMNVANAKSSLENTLVSTFDTANKKVQAMTKTASEDVANAHATLENNNLDFIPTPIIKKELDNAIGSGNNKYFKNLVSKNNKLDTLGAENQFQNKEVAPGVKLSDLPPSAQEQYRQQSINQGQTKFGQIARSGNTIDSLIAQPGTGTSAVGKAISLINDSKNGLVNEFSKTGKTSLSAIEAHSMALENAIDKGFSGQSVPKGLVATMAKIKQAINPTKLFEKYPNELSHLEPLAAANKSYSAQIDGLRNALNLYKDNVDGTVNPQKVFNALDRNNSTYIAKLRQADEVLPKEDRIFDKVKNAYDNFKTVESSEKMALSNTEKAISNQRLGLNKKFDDMKRQLNIEQRKELAGKIKEKRDTKRMFSQQQANALKDLHDKQRQSLNLMQSQKDKELGLLQESVNKRLHDLHLLHMARGSRASATGNARIFQNVANYRSIDGMTTLNPLKMIQGSVISKFASPSGAANTLKGLLNAPNFVRPGVNAAKNSALKAILATKGSGR